MRKILCAIVLAAVMAAGGLTAFAGNSARPASRQATKTTKCIYLSAEWGCPNEGERPQDGTGSRYGGRNNR